ncbi:MAG: DUF1194 domain-containing protein [Stellaceae bacterium]
MMVRTLAAAVLAFSALIAVRAAAAEADLALVLAVDVSSSINEERFGLQREGIAKGLESREILDAIAGGPHQTIELAVIEWSERQHVVVDWTVIRGRADLEPVLKALRTSPRPNVGYKTNVAAGIVNAAGLFETAPLLADRKIIDVSGDGQQNDGTLAAEAARDMAVAQDITINGLPITSGEEPEVDRWYRSHVVGGDGAFMVVANGHDSFADAIHKKLSLEVAGVLLGTRFAAINERPGARGR